MKNNCDQDSQLSKQIVQWYLKKGRNDLPWRKNVTAYRVWISEIMLQQTQVKTVIPFFKKFISRYPNLKALSSANEEEILACLLYTSPSPRDTERSRMPSSA